MDHEGEGERKAKESKGVYRMEEEETGIGN